MRQRDSLCREMVYCPSFHTAKYIVLLTAQGLFLFLQGSAALCFELISLSASQLNIKEQQILWFRLSQTSSDTSPSFCLSLTHTRTHRHTRAHAGPSSFQRVSLSDPTRSAADEFNSHGVSEAGRSDSYWSSRGICFRGGGPQGGPQGRRGAGTEPRMYRRGSRGRV